MASNSQLIDRLLDEIQKTAEEEKNLPLQISIMGQTGVGKTSLINALFNTNLKKDSVLPATEDITTIKFKGESGNELWFHDLPGIGESKRKNAEYIENYRQKLIESDVVLWAIHADSRSFTFDVDALNKILETPNEQYRKQLFRKITFILTKADLIIEDRQHIPSPWVLADFEDYAKFVPQKPIKDLLGCHPECCVTMGCEVRQR